jgi:iron complex transport system ATP-binding protein
MEMKNSEILSIDSLKIGYASGRQTRILLPPLTASAGRGELVAVIGRNGIGKSTLLRSIIGLQPSFGGNVLINGENLTDIPRLEIARRIGYISTEIIRVSNMKVYDLVALGRFPHTNWIGRIDSKSSKAISNAISRTGMSRLAGRYIAELSDGERQRVMIARILAQDADIMVMDEPTAFLDIMSRHEVVNLMLELAREGKTIIFSTHDFNIALNQADKIWLTLEDNLVEGAPEDLVISMAFDRLFDSDTVGFNADDGSFTFHNESRGRIHIIGDGLMRHWTEKAVRRAGYSLSDQYMIPYIKVPDADSEKWLLVTENKSTGFDTIYNLVREL